MKIAVTVLEVSPGRRLLEPGQALNIGSAPGVGDPFRIRVPGRPALSMRALELYNTGSSLMVTSFQRPESGTVTIGATGGGQPRTAIFAPTPFLPPVELEIVISLRDGSAPVTVRVVDDGAAPDPACTDVPDADAASDEDLVLLVNCIAVLVADHPGAPLQFQWIQRVYLPCIQRSPRSNRKLRTDLDSLKRRYGVQDHRALADMAAHGRAIRDVTTESMAEARQRIAQGQQWWDAEKAGRRGRGR